MAISYLYSEGLPEAALPGLRRTLGAYARHGAFHQKVGLTADPEHRWRIGYANYGWTRMNVVYSTDIYEHAQAVERGLEEYCEFSMTGGYYHNRCRGGGGRKAAEGPYWVYIVGAEKYCRVSHWSDA